MINPSKTKQAEQLKHNSPLMACRYDPTGKYLFFSAQDSSIQRWEPAAKKKTPLLAHKSWVRGMTFAPQHKLLITADFTGKIILWPWQDEQPKPAKIIPAHRGWARAVAVSPDGKLLASCGNDNMVKLWSLPGGDFVRDIAGHDCRVYNVCFHPQGKFLVSADLKGSVKQWDLGQSGSGAPVRELDAKVLHKFDPTFRAIHGGIRSMCFNKDASLLACAGIYNVKNAFAGVGNPGVVLFDWAAGKQKHLLTAKAAFRGTCWGVAFHPDGFILGTAGGSGGQLYFWKPDNAKSIFTLKLPNNSRDLSLHPKGNQVAIPFYDGTLRTYALTA